jgi:hypothetical protein
LLRGSQDEALEPDAPPPAAVALVAVMAALDRGRLHIIIRVKTVGEVNARLESPQPADRCRHAGRSAGTCR